MSLLHVRQIKAFLEKTFNGLIDLSDVKESNKRESVFLSRALAAFAIMKLAEINPEEASSTITDGSQDNGLDAIYYQKNQRVLYIVQSKWKYDGKGSIDRGSVGKFIKGINDLTAGNFDRFNEKIMNRQTEIEQVLLDANNRFIVLLVYSGKDPLSEEVNRDIQDFLSEMNDPDQIMSLTTLRQGGIYNFIKEGITGVPINVEIALYNWAIAKEPYTAYYGQVAASDISEWWFKYYYRLFAPNIRSFLGDTDVNDSLMTTLEYEPERFWYYNNGITALCSSIKKKHLGGKTQDSGTFEIENLRIVNGAQTVGCIAAASSWHQSAVERARVLIRIIDLENCPEGFEKEITRANNTQNRIDRRDFVALDHNQERIQSELHLDDITYIYKSGELIGDDEVGFDLVEATVARACVQSDVAFSVQAKREIGKLWESIDKEPYKVLFNPSVNGPDLWRLVQILRIVELQLAKFRKTYKQKEQSRLRLFSVHCNRFLLHLLFYKLTEEYFDFKVILDDSKIKNIKNEINSIYTRIVTVTDELYPDSVLASLFKNLTKCRNVKDNLYKFG